MPTLNLKTYARAADFLCDVQDHLEQREVANSLMLGLAMRLLSAPSTYGDDPPYFAAVFDGDAPALATLLTPPHSPVLSADHDVPVAAFEVLARDLVARGLPVPGVLGPVSGVVPFAETWVCLAGVERRRGVSMRLYELREVTPPPYSPGRLRPAGDGDSDLIVGWMDAFHREATPNGPAPAAEATRRRIAESDVFVWEDNTPVAMALKTRPTRHGVSIGGVYTPPGLRRRGYATSCVAALSRQLLDAGFEYCALFTDLSNPTSNAIYQQIGYTPVCDFQEILFS